MKVYFLPIFIRHFNKLEPELQEEAIEKIELFRNKRNHTQLKVHKLYGRLANRYSFSVNYKTRIVFTYISKQEAVLLAIGDHTVYNT